MKDYKFEKFHLCLGYICLIITFATLEKMFAVLAAVFFSTSAIINEIRRK